MKLCFLTADLMGDDGRPLRDAFTGGRFVFVGTADVLDPWADRIETVAVRGRRAFDARPDGVMDWADDGSEDDDALQRAADRRIGPASRF